uniref:Complement C3-like n=1 Tax=Geotrypetes seraphini TaxID=260995 RepID=A0A6P8PVL8_GEOSA|nr:complement C3-like [Geotrypetes seraphini]
MEFGLLLFLVLCPELSYAANYFMLVTPNVLRVNSDENIVIHAHDFSESTTVTITVFEFPKNNQVLNRTSIQLRCSEKPKVNGCLATATIKIPSSYVSSDSKEKQYVDIRASAAEFNLQKMVLISPHMGYIFIQTDKTIYTPGKRVNYRVFTMDQSLDPITKLVVIDTQNPDGAVVMQDQKNIPNGMLSQSLQIPDIASFGSWKILAHFQDAPQKIYSTEFEVREFVLPTFEVMLKPAKKFFYINNPELTIEISAKYVYNKPVDGYAIAIFGITKDPQRVTLDESLIRTKITNGRGMLKLAGDVLKRAIPNREELLGASIFVNVTAFSSGGDMVQAETSGIRIVTSPYKISFTRTPRYYKHGFTLNVMICITNPDESPADRVSIEGVTSASSEKFNGISNEDGIVLTFINTGGNDKNMTITVRTTDPSLQENQQAEASLTVKAYESQTSSSNYLHIGVESMDTKLGNLLRLNLYTKNAQQAVKEKIKYITVLLLSKGKLVRQKIQTRESQSELTSMCIEVTPDLLPAFRIVAYYFLSLTTHTEVVADSILIHVTENCMGKLKVSAVDESQHGKVYRPKEMYNLVVTGDLNATVGLVAVDRAIFALNEKNRFSQKKVWAAIAKSDIGCSPGSGANSLGVFRDAGLDVVSNWGFQTQARKELTCPQPPQRKRRSITIMQRKLHKVHEFPAELQKCCKAGLQESPTGLSCEERAAHVRLGKDCVLVFLNCCREAEKMSWEARENLEHSRAEDDCEDCANDVLVRSYFPESWLWDKITLEEEVDQKLGLGRYVLQSRPLPDSITTWEVLAVSIRTGRGLCVSEPYKLVVAKDFFIDLRLPYSVVRNEQVQIRAVLYNYGSLNIKVMVVFPYNDKVCATAARGKRYQVEVTVPAASSVMVPYVLVPLEVGLINIEVQAFVMGMFVSDGVRKPLLVVPEGQIQRVSRSYVLQPKDGPQTIPIKGWLKEDLIPDTEPTNYFSFQGDIMGETLLGTLRSSYLESLIRVPFGCAEQNMIGISPNVIMTHYLDDTRQWHLIGVERRSDAIRNIISGITRQLTFQQPDHSYKGSTWLTAYVVKIYAMANSLVFVDTVMLCESVRWLLMEKQKPDGLFQEDGTVYSKPLQGGYLGSEQDASLTAFVLIALKEVEPTCGNQIRIMANGMKKAEAYLEKRLPQLSTVYSVAISSYALALMGNFAADSVIDNFKFPGRPTWVVNREPFSEYSMEATAYALLQKLTLGKIKETHIIANWLVERRQFGGGFGNTQNTVIAMQALAKYMTSLPSANEIDLQINMTIDGRSRPNFIIITNSDAYLERTNQIPAAKNVQITVTGKGTGTMTVMTVYHTPLSKQVSKCNSFDLRATVENVPARMDRQKEGIYESFILRIRTRYTGDYGATMTLIEINMLTGFVPDKEDLKKLTNNVENYISQFETQTTVNNGTVIIYLDKVSTDQDTVIGFKIHKYFPVALLQPAAITIYEYYDQVKRCTKFYHLPNQSGELRKLCQGQVCVCAEEKCPSQQNNEEIPTLLDLVNEACKSGVDFVYKAKLVNSEQKDSYFYHNMTILDVIKEGTDMKAAETPTSRRFINHMACEEKLRLEANKEYLIMGMTSDLWETQAEMTYALSSSTYILWWPEEEMLREVLQHFSDHIKTSGCET